MSVRFAGRIQPVDPSRCAAAARQKTDRQRSDQVDTCVFQASGSLPPDIAYSQYVTKSVGLSRARVTADTRLATEILEPYKKSQCHQK